MREQIDLPIQPQAGIQQVALACDQVADAGFGILFEAEDKGVELWEALIRAEISRVFFKADILSGSSFGKDVCAPTQWWAGGRVRLGEIGSRQFSPHVTG